LVAGGGDGGLGHGGGDGGLGTNFGDFGDGGLGHGGRHQNNVALFMLALETVLVYTKQTRIRFVVEYYN
jgi:hypothetical protein